MQKKLFIILFCLIAAVALVYSEAFINPGRTPKMFWFYFFSALFLSSFFVAEIVRKDLYSIKLNLPDIALLAFYAYSFIRLFTTSHISVDSFSFISQTFLLLIYFVLRRFIASQQNNQRFTMYILLGLFVLCGVQIVIGFAQYFGFLQKMTHGFIMGGTFGNPGVMANYIVSLLPFSLLFALSKQPKYIRATAIVLSALILVILPFTQARTAWVAALVGIVLVAVIQRVLPFERVVPLPNNTFKRIAFTAVCISLATVFFVALFHYKKDSANGRLFIWQRSVEIIADNPVFGAGYNSFATTYPNYQAEYFKNKPNDTANGYLAGDNDNAFNEFVELTTELGIVGLLLFLVFVFLLLRKGFSTTLSAQNKPEVRNETSTSKSQAQAVPSMGRAKTEHLTALLLIGSAISIIVILTTSIFSYPFHSNAIMLHFYLFAAIISSLPHISASSEEEKEKVMRKPFVYSVPYVVKIKRSYIRLLSITAIIGLLFFLGVQYKHFRAEMEWTKISAEARKGNWQPDKFAELYPVLKYNPLFLFNYGASLNMYQEYAKSITIMNEANWYLHNSDTYSYLGNSYKAINDLLRAEKMFLQASHIVPHKFYPKYELATIYLATNRKEQAIAMAKHILNMKVKVNTPLVVQIKEEMKVLLEESEYKLKFNKF